MSNEINTQIMEALVRPLQYEENTENLVRAMSYEEDKKTYLVLLEGEIPTNEGENYKTYEFILGRQATYDYIKDIIQSQDIIFDAMKSKVIVDSEKVNIGKALSVYNFMRIMKENNKVVDESSFDIEDYYYDIEEKENNNG